jgi:hypothetical protein
MEILQKLKPDGILKEKKKKMCWKVAFKECTWGVNVWMICR